MCALPETKAEGEQRRVSHDFGNQESDLKIPVRRHKAMHNVHPLGDDMSTPDHTPV